MIQLNGSYLEGGGQIIRTALALSTITKKAFEVNNIRKKRPNPGLKNQHLYCIKALEQLCNAKTEGAQLGSTSLRYEPENIQSKTIIVDIGTAGSITLLLQGLLLPCLFARSEVRIKIIGGTDVRWSMPFDYFNELFIPYAGKFADIDITLIRRGYYPKGAGEIDVKIIPKEKNPIPPIDIIETGKLISISGTSHASTLLQKAEVADRQAKEARRLLQSLNIPIDIQAEYVNTLSPGSGITLFAQYEKTILAADALGEKGKASEAVAKEAVNQLFKEIKQNAPIDSHLADNLIPILGIVGGRMKVTEITDHTRANIYVTEKFLNIKFSIEDNIISVEASQSL